MELVDEDVYQRTLYVDGFALFRENWHLKDNWLSFTTCVTRGRGGCGGRGGAAEANLREEILSFIPTLTIQPLLPHHL